VVLERLVALPVEPDVADARPVADDELERIVRGLASPPPSSRR